MTIILSRALRDTLTFSGGQIVVPVRLSYRAPVMVILLMAVALLLVCDVAIG